MTGVRLSIVLPCYNEAANLPLILEGYRREWRDLPTELILVDNGSTDTTEDVLERELARPVYAFARSLRIETNRGYGHGIHTGLESARGEFLCFSHADMQCSPVDPFRAYRKASNAREPRRVVVKGSRAWRGLGPALLTGGMTVLSSAILWKDLRDNNAQPKLFHRDLLESLRQPPDGFPYDLYVLYRARCAGFDLETIPVRFDARAHGESKWAFSFVSRWRTIWDTIRFIFALRLGRVG